MEDTPDKNKENTRTDGTDSEKYRALSDADTPLHGLRRRTIAVRITWYIAGVVLTLLAFRFVLPLLGANLDTGFASGIFHITNPLVYPFTGLFRNFPLDSTLLMEPNVLIAMAVYALIAWGIVKMITIAR